MKKVLVTTARILHPFWFTIHGWARADSMIIQVIRECINCISYFILKKAQNRWVLCRAAFFLRCHISETGTFQFMTKGDSFFFEAVKFTHDFFWGPCTEISHPNTQLYWWVTPQFHVEQHRRIIGMSASGLVADFDMHLLSRWCVYDDHTSHLSLTCSLATQHSHGQ